jgi:putative transposase
LIDADTYLLELSRYIHLNPVRAGIVVKPESYSYSSYRAYTFPKEETIVFRNLLWGMISGERKRSPQRYREFVESALTQKIRNPFEKVYGGVILGGRSFIKEVLQRVQDQRLEKEETSYGRSLVSGGLDIDEVVDFLTSHLRVPREEVISSSPYRGYAVYLSRKHTACPNKEIGRYFGGISYSAVTKIGTRL